MDLIRIAQNIRSVRIAQKMTVEQLAQRSGFSKGFISQVENFRTTPSLKALVKLAEALGLQVSDLFFSDDPTPEFTFGSLDDGVELVRNDNLQYGIRYFALAYKHISRSMDPFVVEYTPADKCRDFLQHDTEEFFLVLEGELDYYLIDNSNHKRLKAGDTVYMKAFIPHRVELPPGVEKAKAVLVYSAGTPRNSD